MSIVSRPGWIGPLLITLLVSGCGFTEKTGAAGPGPEASVAVLTESYTGFGGDRVRIHAWLYDSTGDGVKGRTLRFTTSGGEPESGELRTDDDGQAVFEWKLPQDVGAFTTTVTPDGGEVSATFHATVQGLDLPIGRDPDWFTAGDAHICGLDTSGTAHCWGRGDEGQLGNGSNSSVAGPTPVAGPTFQQISAGSHHTCGIDGAGRAFCWGRNAHGRLGTGNTISSNTPVLVETELRFRQISAGFTSTCAVIAQGDEVYCWGNGAHGLLGNGSEESSLVPVKVAGASAYRHVGVGRFHACAVVEPSQPSNGGRAECWGEGPLIGVGRLGTFSVPQRVEGMHRFAQLDVGEAHTCGILRSGLLMCWGGNAEGALGQGDRSNRPFPTSLLSQERMSQVATGGEGCAVNIRGEAFCWGSAHGSVVGDGFLFHSLVPHRFGEGIRFLAVANGNGFACGVDPRGQAYCAGSESSGQLGQGGEVGESRRALPVVGNVRFGRPVLGGMPGSGGGG